MMSYGYSQEEIAGIHEWVVEGDRTESTAVKFVEAYVEAGAQHLIMMLGAPFDFGNVEKLLASAES